MVDLPFDRLARSEVEPLLFWCFGSDVAAAMQVTCSILERLEVDFVRELKQALPGDIPLPP